MNMTIEKISRDYALSGSGTLWGTRLAGNAVVAWECPMRGDGGDHNAISALAELLAVYSDHSGVDWLDPEDGPDEIMFQHPVTSEYYLITITLS